MEVKDTKSLILKPIFNLEHCNTINGLNNRSSNKKYQKCTFKDIARSFSPFTDLQCSILKIGFKINTFIFWTSFCTFKSFDNYVIESALSVLFCESNHLFSPFVELQCSKMKIVFKINDFVFLASILVQFCPFLFFQGFYSPHMPTKVLYFYWFRHTTVCSVHLQIYSVSN